MLIVYCFFNILLHLTLQWEWTGWFVMGYLGLDISCGIWDANPGMLSVTWIWPSTIFVMTLVDLPYLCFIQTISQSPCTALIIKNKGYKGSLESELQGNFPAVWTVLGTPIKWQESPRVTWVHSALQLTQNPLQMSSPNLYLDEAIAHAVSPVSGVPGGIPNWQSCNHQTGTV